MDLSDCHLAAPCSRWELIPALAQYLLKCQGLLAGLMSGFGTACDTQALQDNAYQGGTATPGISAVLGSALG